MLAVELAVVVGLILLNGFLAMSELALVSAKRPLLERMARGGSRGATVALELIREPGRMLSAVQIGITLVGIVAGAFSGATIAERLDSWLEGQGMATRIAEPLAFTLVIVTITYLSVVLGELVPKQVGLRNSERVAALVALPMQGLATVAGPVVALLDWSSRVGLLLLRQAKHSAPVITDDEIRTMIDEAERTGVVEPEERSMISRVMLLGDRSVRAIMTPRTEVDWVDLQDSDDDVRATVRKSTHARLLAANGNIDSIAGVIPTRAALVALLDREGADVRTLVQPIPAVSDRLSAIDVVEQLRRSSLNMVVVIDEHGSLEGVVTEGDILKAIVADIEAEGAPRILRRDDGSLLIDGAFPVDELGGQLGVALPSARDYHTVAGFVLEQLGRVPEVGESFLYNGWRIEVMDVDGRRIDKVLASPHPTLHRTVGRPPSR